MKSLSKEGPFTPLVRWIGATCRQFMAAFGPVSGAQQRRVVEDHIYIDELNQVLRAHPAFRPGMRFELKDPDSIAAVVDDIIPVGAPAGHPLILQVTADVAARLELEQIPFP
jgi:hypothetical protein